MATQSRKATSNSSRGATCQQRATQRAQPAESEPCKQKYAGRSGDTDMRHLSCWNDTSNGQRLGMCRRSGPTPAHVSPI
eukprot:9658850-Karenia_brevis.AAC.1